MENDEIILDSTLESDLNTHKNIVYLFFKRLFDIVISLIGIIPLIICTIVIKVWSIFTKDFHSIFFKQERIGKNGKKIYIYKFRSMVPNAEDVLEKMMKENPKIKKEYLENKKLEKDPRITSVGKFIRKLSIDEVPQLLNVLKGDMSLVGPRPYLPREKNDMKNYYNYVISCKPGITGLWQVSGRSDVSFTERLKLDKKYSKEKGLFYDFKILCKTFIVVFKRKGAK